MNILSTLALAASVSTGLAGIRYGAPPPDFYVPGPHGAVPLRTLRGKPVVLNFWATWCPPCTAELPYFTRLKREYGDRIAVLTISKEPSGVAREYLVAHHENLPLLEDLSGKVFSAYAILPIPDTVVLDSAGNVSYVSVGGIDWAELEGAVSVAFGAAATPAIGTPTRPLLI